MPKPISEQALEDAICNHLASNRYSPYPHAVYDKTLCLDAGPRIDFIPATQPKVWEKYREQHGVGSGKSNSIAWLAHRLASLHGPDYNRVFDAVIVVTDRVAASFTVNTREIARLTFDHKVRERFQGMIDTNFKFFK